MEKPRLLLDSILGVPAIRLTERAPYFFFTRIARNQLFGPRHPVFSSVFCSVLPFPLFLPRWLLSGRGLHDELILLPHTARKHGLPLFFSVPIRFPDTPTASPPTKGGHEAPSEATTVGLGSHEITRDSSLAPEVARGREEKTTPHRSPHVLFSFLFFFFFSCTAATT